MAARLERLGLVTLEDALFHLPLRYQDRTRVYPIGSLRPGDEGVVTGEVQASDIHFGRRRALLVRISDGSGSMLLRFFHFNAAQKAALARGERLRCFGEVRQGPVMLEMIHPEYQRLGSAGAVVVDEHLTPVYPATEGVSQKSLRSIIGQALAALE
ncbi:MAG TPA: ATP-dependent DNA helicase RecG, partial [Candidatus Tenderia sp.]|nr:ATP-dependent DNA helicase RecG [Candidatus Tenderia sp.]